MIVSVLGLVSLMTMKVDILPDINKPTVTVFAESLVWQQKMWSASS